MSAARAGIEVAAAAILEAAGLCVKEWAPRRGRDPAAGSRPG
jgi:hypothetical protein